MTCPTRPTHPTILLRATLLLLAVACGGVACGGEDSGGQGGGRTREARAGEVERGAGEQRGNEKGEKRGEEKGARAGGGEGEQAGAGGGRPAPAVQVIAVAPRLVEEERLVTGTLAPAREARLTAQLEGAVVALRVEAGDRVRRGQLLARLDASVQTAELTAARSRQRTAQAAAARAARLLALGAASQAEQEEAATAQREAAGQLRAAEARAAYGQVRSPFDGVVTAVFVDAGDVVGARQELVVVADARDLRVEVPVSELDVVRLRPGARAAVTVDAVPDRTFAGRIRRIYPTVDPVTRQGVVEVELPGAGATLRPGLLARIALVVDRARDALAVPLDAVRRDVRDRTYVYVVADSIVLRRPVRVGLRGADNYTVVDQGLRAGDRVVVSGDQELSDSARVRVVPNRPGAPPSGRADAPAGGRSGGR